MIFYRKFRKLVTKPNLFMHDFLLKRGVELRSIIKNNNPDVKKNPISQTASKPKEIIGKKTKEQYIHSRIALGNMGDVFYARLSECCKNMNITFMTGAAPDKWMHGMHINHSDIKIFSKLLDFWFSDNEKYFVRFKNNIYSIKEAISRKDFYTQGSFDILCVEKEWYDSNSNTRIYYSSIIHFMLWKKLDGYSSESMYSICEKNKYIHRLRTPIFDDYMKSYHHIDDDNNISDVTFPIDVVYTWVDGDDKEWKVQKDLYSTIGTGEYQE
ncbi:TPA: Stealth CR1 domain-containing protein, partial [Yersinia enterocolitica]